jgi:glyoxylase-like metal-dependent hydrolase (beta-lactamase superfamily II)
MQRISENVYLIKSTISNQFLILNKDKMALIDTGLKGNSNNIKKSVGEIGKNIYQLEDIFITHADGDHYGSLNDLIKLSGARSFASEIESSAIKTGTSSRKLKPSGVQKYIFGAISPLFRNESVDIDQIIKPGDVYPYIEGLEALSTPGHTPGHISFFARKERILFSGDSIRINGKDLSPSSGGNNWNEELSSKSFEFQMTLKPRFICGGHGFIEIS